MGEKIRDGDKEGKKDQIKKERYQEERQKRQKRKKE